MELLPNSRDFKILMLSNATWVPSGYGVQANAMAYEWNKYYHTRILANYGLQGAWMGVNDLIHYPILTGDAHGDKTARLVFSHWKPDVFITLYDIWMNAFTNMRGNAIVGAIHPHWVPIIMVDHQPCPEATLANAMVAHKVVTPTRYGEQEFLRNGIDATYIPFGVDSFQFQPFPDKAPAKKWLNGHSTPFNMREQTGIDEDSFVVGMVGANKDPYRKAFMRSFIGIQIFLENNPDAVHDLRVYVHSWMNLSRDIPHGAKTLHIDRLCRGTPDYYNLIGTPQDDMVRMYNSFDMFLHPSQGGGFEVPILEAMSCGVPVAGSDFIGMTELVKDHGWLLPAIKEQHRSGKDAKSLYFSPLDATQIIVNEFSIADAIEDAYNHPDRAVKTGAEGRRFAEGFDWKLVHPMWLRFFEELRNDWRTLPLPQRAL